MHGVAAVAAPEQGKGNPMADQIIITILQFGALALAATFLAAIVIL